MKSKTVDSLTILFLSLMSSSLVEGITFKDGLVHNIDSRLSDSVVIDYEAPGMQTTVNFLSGAHVPYPYGLGVYEDGIVNVLGGFIVGHTGVYGRSTLNISGGSLSSDVTVSGSSQMNVSGGSIGYDSELNTFDTSKVSLSGGSIAYLTSSNDSEVEISGGSIRESVVTSDRSQVSMSGGTIDDDLITSDNSKVRVSGGTISDTVYTYNYSTVALSGGSAKYLRIYGFSVVDVLEDWTCDLAVTNFEGQINVFGGKIDRLALFDNSSADIYGGLIDSLVLEETSKVSVTGGSVSRILETKGTSEAIISGGSIARELKVQGRSTLSVLGVDFSVDGEPVEYGAISDMYGHLAGVLLSGEQIDIDFDVSSNAKIILIPEPATLLLLGLSGLIVHRRRQA